MEPQLTLLQQDASDVKSHVRHLMVNLEQNYFTVGNILINHLRVKNIPEPDIEEMAALLHKTHLAVDGLFAKFLASIPEVIDQVAMVYLTAMTELLESNNSELLEKDITSIQHLIFFLLNLQNVTTIVIDNPHVNIVKTSKAVSDLSRMTM